MNCEIIRKDGVAIVEVYSNVAGIEDCTFLSKEMRKLLEEEVSCVILDFSEATFVTASFCGFLASVSQTAKEKGIKFAMAVPSGGPTSKMLSILSLDRVIDIYPSLAMCDIGCMGEMA